MSVKTLHERLPEYTQEDLNYTCLKLHEAGFINLQCVPVLGSTMPSIVSIGDLSYHGHEFLNSVRDNKNWSQIKDVAKKAGIFSIKGISQIAESVAVSAITAALQQH